MPNERPAHEVRLGTIKATIWKNDTGNGARYNTSFVRLYRDDNEWRSTGSFGRDDLLVLAKVADQAHSWICEQSQEEVQRRIFERILCCCAEHGNKILSMHAVRSGREVLTLIEKRLPQDRGRAVLHWFSGSKSEAKWASEFGCYFSINAEMLKRESGRVLVASLPRQRLLTETDGPFTLTGNVSTQPSDVVRTIALLADTLKTGESQLRHDIRENLRALETSRD